MRDTITPIVADNKSPGRPCKYQTHVEPRLQEIEQWIRDGLTDYCIAENLGIGVSTLYDYKNKYLELSETYTRAYTRQVQKVVNSMYSRALGYDAEEKVMERPVIKDDKGDIIGYGELTETKRVTKHIPGDINAQKFYLINRDKENWKSERLVEINHNTTNNFQLEDWRDKRKQILAEIQKLEMQSAVDVEPIEGD